MSATRGPGFWSRARRVALSLGCAGLLNGCPDPNAPTYELEAFNGEDAIDVHVLPGEPGAPLEVDLTSSTGETVVGTVQIDPGSGPVGTIHRVTVRVSAAFADRIERAELDIDAGDRGSRTIVLDRDSADERVFVRELVSFGEEGEDRVDQFTVVLLELVEVATTQ